MVSHWPHPVSSDHNLFGSFWQEPLDIRTIKRHMEVGLQVSFYGLQSACLYQHRLCLHLVKGTQSQLSVPPMSAVSCCHIFLCSKLSLQSITEVMRDKWLTGSIVLKLWDWMSLSENTGFLCRQFTPCMQIIKEVSLKCRNAFFDYKRTYGCI